tara:strand:- start:572 stop:1537 length:966 start_codon:yes stop_codon:yes gene_type:complete
MKIESSKISKVLEQNFSHLICDFYEMQTEYLASLNIIYDDLDASLVGMFLTNELYKSAIQNDISKEKICLKSFYQKNNFKLPVSNFKIKDISSIINLPRETVRRKKEKLLKDRIILYNKKKKFYSLNSEMIDKKVLDIQIENLSKFLSKFSIYFSKNKLFINEVSKDEIKKDVDEKFLIYLTKFLDFQIAYFSNLKSLFDIESIFITMLCSLNTLSAKSIKKEKPISVRNIFSKIHEMNKSFGLNATSIAEITKIPRTTVLRKISNLEKNGILKKDKFKRYASDNLSTSAVGNKLLPVEEDNLKLLAMFFSQCLETYSAKS